MSEAIEVFVAGISGVFLGMAFLYLAIRLVSLVLARMEQGGAEE
jgi:Na+-transporting methylmalonyl-CoA/oxaloacetate decarboxylase gamma subunit